MKNPTPFLIAALILAACGTDPVVPSSHKATLVVEQGGNVSAAVNAAEAYDLRVRFIDGSGAALVNQPFTFETTAPSSFEASNASGTYRGSTSAQLQTDANGSASFHLVFNKQAGQTTLRFRMTPAGIVDSVVYTMLPGPAAKLTLTPKDTTVFKSTTFTPHVVVTDEWGNAVTSSTTLSTSSAAASVSGANIGAENYARVVVKASTTANGRTLVDSMFVSIVPKVKVATTDDAGFLHLNWLDGTTVNYPSFVGRRGSDLARTWGQELVTVSMTQPRSIVRFASNGLVFPIETNQANVSTPAQSKDLQSLYWVAPTIGVERLNLVTATMETIPGTADAEFMTLSPGGDSIVFANRNGVTLRDLKTGISSSLFNGAVTSVVWSPDGKTVAVFALHSVSLIRLSDLNTRTFAINSASDGSWSSDSQWLLVGAGALSLIRVDTGEMIPVTNVVGREPVWLDWVP